MYKLVLLRHGQSQWNLENKFTGWTDVDLSEKGVKEATLAGKTLIKENLAFDIVFTSVLKRAIHTTQIVLDKMNLHWLPVIKAWQLNERHYGALQGLNKVETSQKYGEDQVFIWRRSFDIQPPALEKTDNRYPGNDPRYTQLSEEELPVTESLKETIARVLPYWHKNIVPEIKIGKNVLISAHGNSIRALIKYLDDVSEKEITQLNIPTGIPLIYELDENLRPIKHYYLGDEDAVNAAISQVANQGKA